MINFSSDIYCGYGNQIDYYAKFTDQVENVTIGKL